MMSSFKVLIANRGEIALRIVRGCRDLGIPCVAVYSEADRDALHVHYADEAYELGPAPAAESYLNAAKIIAVAKKSGATAIHPGYGFLSENAGFAQACADAGLIFIGPSPETISLLGDKVQAKAVMRAAGVPVVPGVDDIASVGDALRIAAEVGYPVLIKAAGGGGGRGMRVVHLPDEMASSITLASTEAGQAFGNSTVYLEKYLSPVRHIEVQVMADSDGRVNILGERECSLQRRHQKLIEESPSPAVSPELRHKLEEAARAGAAAANYRGAGTVEFLLDEQGNFYFLEVNTRLQVEHPVTEWITSTDLVRDQLLVAMGQPLSYDPEHRPAINGWSMECRITAEDPYNDFLPTAGRVRILHQPAGPGVRVDSSLYVGQEITSYYDSLLAKVITWGPDRLTAINRMQRALQEYTIIGVKTSIPFHLFALADEDFRAGRMSTDFIEHKSAELRAQAEQQTLVAALSAALLAHTQPDKPVQGKPAPASRPINPWVAEAPRQGSPLSPWVNATRPMKEAGPSWQRPQER